MLGKSIIDVTIIATLRPDILRRTLDSFSWMVRSEHHLFRAILNVDEAPKGREPGLAAEVISVVQEYMPLKYAHIAANPSFARAVKHVWSNTSSRYVLHLEDDWEFIREINIDWCIEELEAWRADYIRFSKREVKVASEDHRPSLLPSLWPGSTVRSLAKHMTDTKDPEKQLRRGLGNELIDAFLPQKIVDYPGGMCVRDIGREWREERGLQKWNKVMASGEDLSFTGEITWKHG